MSRRDDYLDAMLRHLGAAYYESLHGRAARSDVARALDTVEGHLNEHGERSGAAPPEPGAQPAHHGAWHGWWAGRVSDLMTRSVVTVDRITPYQEIARLLTEHKIGGVPVLMMGRQVVGVVTESDLLAAEDKAARDARLDAESPGRWRLHKPPLATLTADTLMSKPAITIRPGATIAGATRMMNTHGIGRLPVVDSKGTLAGIVSRRDLLSVFLRPDADLARDVGQVLEGLPLVDPKGTVVRARHGVVNLSGPAESASLRQQDLIAVVLRLVWDVDGVVDVVNRLGGAMASKTAWPGAPRMPRQPEET
jgi:CBS domain-containing protein